MPKFQPFCFVGLNGSGKSNVLEAIAAIFYHLEMYVAKFQPKSFEKYFRREICSLDAFVLKIPTRILSGIRFASCATTLRPDTRPNSSFHDFSSTSNLQLNVTPVSVGFFTWLRPRSPFPLTPLFTTFLRSSAQSLIFYSYLCPGRGGRLLVAGFPVPGRLPAGDPGPLCIF